MAEFSAGSSADFAPNSMRTVRAGAKNIVVFRAEDGNFCALEDRCSHAEVRLSGGILTGNTIECPAHGAKFDVRSGKHLCMPAVSPVKAFRVEVRDGEVFVVIP